MTTTKGKIFAALLATFSCLLQLPIAHFFPLASSSRHLLLLCGCPVYDTHHTPQIRGAPFGIFHRDGSRRAIRLLGTTCCRIGVVHAHAATMVERHLPKGISRALFSNHTPPSREIGAFCLHSLAGVSAPHRPFLDGSGWFFSLLADAFPRRACQSIQHPVRDNAISSCSCSGRKATQHETKPRHPFSLR